MLAPIRVINSFQYSKNKSKMNLRLKRRESGANGGKNLD
ncbi:hypothetical protein LEP1GSC162_0781 [Leptospira santarosai str. CBC1531]|nr:hypothetical protein LEP1GSC162_0781 [Leptospira santarosai str. CBC1531]